jgi:hypothetical protein
MSAIEWVKKIYIYLFSAIGLVIVIIGSVQFINLGLKAWIFTKADVYYNYPAPVTVPEKGQTIQQPDQKAVDEFQQNNLVSQRQRDAANAIAMIIVGAPLFLYHWRLARKQP